MCPRTARPKRLFTMREIVMRKTKEQSFAAITNESQNVRRNAVRRHILCTAFGIALAAASLAVNAKPSTFDIKPQPTDSALLQLAETAEIQILFSPGATKNTHSSGLQGMHSVRSAMAAALAGTGLTYEFKSADFVVVKHPAKAEAAGSLQQVFRGHSAGERRSGVKLAQLQESAESSQPDEEDEEEDGREDPLQLGTQTVTGSRIAKRWWQISSQVIRISAEDLRNTGAPTLERALRELPQNINGATEFGGATPRNNLELPGGVALLGTANINGSSTINLRGVGETATLVLIDGKRAGDSGLLGGFTDISEVPLSMVERVEIQLDGASAVYGSDAIGGVVNVILKKDYDLVRITLRRTARTGGGLTEDNLSVVGGWAWGTGNAMLSADAYQASPQDVSQTGLQLGRERFRYNNPGNVGGRGLWANPPDISRDFTQKARGAGLIGPDEKAYAVPIPAGQDGVGLTMDDFLNDSINTFRVNEQAIPPNSVSPSSDRYQVRVSARQAVADWLNVSGGVSYASRKTSSDRGYAGGPLLFNVPPQNPYNPFGDTVYVYAYLTDYGITWTTGDRDSLTLDLDFDGTAGGGWDWALQSRFADRESASATFNLIDTRYSRTDALYYVARDRNRVDPSEALNVFGNSFATDGNNAAILAGLDFQIPVLRSATVNTLASSELLFRGALFSLPAGPVQAAVGAEWRKTSTDTHHGANAANRFRVIDGFTSPVLAGDVLAGYTLKGTRLSRAGFAEFFVPLVSKANALPGVSDLGITLGGRHERYDGSSNAGAESASHYQSNVWSAGLVYRPIEAVKVRVGKSTSYRAPDVANSLFPPLVSPGFLIDIRTNAPSLFAFPEFVAGGNPELEPEESASVTAGVEAVPVPGLTLSVDYHDTLYQNRLARLNFGGILVLTDLQIHRFGFQYTLDADGSVLRYDSRITNIALVETKGWDYGLAWEFEWGGSVLGLSANMAETKSFIQDLNTYDSEEAEEFVGSVIPRRQYTAGAFIRRGGWYLALKARSGSSLRYELLQQVRKELATDTQNVRVKAVPPTVVDFRGTLDMNEAWSSAPGFLRDVQLAFGLNNVFRSVAKTVMDPEPDGGGTGIPRGMNDARGQLYYLEVSKEF